MPARTGQQFLNGLRGDREVWVEGRRVRDVVSHPAFAGAARRARRRLRSAAPRADRCLIRGLRNGRADQREPSDSPFARGSAQAPRLSGRHRRIFGRSDGPHAGLHERHVRGFRRPRRGVGDQRQRGGRRAAGRVSEEAAPRRHFADAHHRSADHRQGAGRCAARRQYGRRCARSARPRTASSCPARACCRRSRRLQTSWPCIPVRHCRKARTISRCRSAFRCRRRG